MLVEIDRSTCHGHGRCVVICPEVFEFDDAGCGVVTVPEPAEGSQAAVRKAAANCPEKAIRITAA